jgi:hypothetical protein
VIRLYLTRRNLQTLLNKLDRNRQHPDKPELSACTLVKMDTLHPKYPCTEPVVVIALEDEDYYTDREPGQVHPEDVPK